MFVAVICGSVGCGCVVGFVCRLCGLGLLVFCLVWGLIVVCDAVGLPCSGFTGCIVGIVGCCCG